jgi:hypothetical protein
MKCHEQAASSLAQSLVLNNKFASPVCSSPR